MKYVDEKLQFFLNVHSYGLPVTTIVSSKHIRHSAFAAVTKDEIVTVTPRDNCVYCDRCVITDSLMTYISIRDMVISNYSHNRMKLIK